MLKHKLAAALAVVALASPAVAWAEDEPLPVQIVDAMNKAFGTHPGFRANHAKGVVVEGSFKASPEAPALSKAKLFDGSTIRRPCAFPIRPAYRTCRTVRRLPIRMAWRSSLICRTARKSTW
jgi:hypothetical protein